MAFPGNLLVHACCAPCLIAPSRQLRGEGIRHSAFWYNPNIHPFTEYRARLSSCKVFCAREALPLVIEDEYDLRDFIRAVAEDIDGRCALCYRKRLEMTAKTAAKEGFDAFTTTLLFSRYQNHELIVSLAREAAEKHGVEFFYRDWRPLWFEGKRISKEEDMYRQKYCGCIFSEEERYLGGKK